MIQKKKKTKIKKIINEKYKKKKKINVKKSKHPSPMSYPSRK